MESGVLEITTTHLHVIMANTNWLNQPTQDSPTRQMAAYRVETSSATENNERSEIELY